MQPNTKTFNNLYQAALKLAAQFRTHTWLDNNRLIDECEVAIKSLAPFIDDGKTNNIDKREEAREKAYEGIWFRSIDFRQVIVQLQLEEAINHMDLQLEMEILGHMLAYLPNGTYFKMDDLPQVMEAAGHLYKASKKANKQYAPKVSEETKVLIGSIKNLINEGFSFHIVNGEPEFDGDSEQRLVAKLERRVKELGGMYVIRQLFDREISARYLERLGRYLIYRTKR